jgi:hypothetical protein
MEAREGGWIDDSQAASRILRVVDLLFMAIPTGTGDVRGLLSFVRQRYEVEGRVLVFDKVVSNGLLWLALSAALSKTASEGEHGLDHAFAVADVYREPLLWKSVDAPRLRFLLTRFKGKEGRTPILKSARRTVRLIEAIERRLMKRHDDFSKRQAGKVHVPHDPLWRMNIGFGRVLSESPIDEAALLNIYLRKRGEIRVKSTYYLNLRIAAEHDSKLAQLLDQLAPCWPGHTPTHNGNRMLKPSKGKKGC